MTRIELENGKYTVCHDNGSDLHALRYGAHWRDLQGDGLVLAMASAIEDAHDEARELNARLDNIGRNCAAFEDMAGDLQIANGKLQDRSRSLQSQLDRLQSMMPVWSGSVSAQAQAAALYQIWDLLGAEDQTQAVMALKDLVAKSANNS